MLGRSQLFKQYVCKDSLKYVKVFHPMILTIRYKIVSLCDFMFTLSLILPQNDLMLYRFCLNFDSVIFLKQLNYKNNFITAFINNLD